MNLKRRNGFSLVELMVGMGVMAVLIFMAASVFNSVGSQTRQLNQNLEGEIDRSLGERAIQLDLRGSSPSFNVVTLADDNGKNFFDLDPERSIASMSAKDLARSLTLSPGDGKEFFMLVQDFNKGGVMIYDPAAAYEIGDPPSDVNVPASLKFVSLNKDNYVKAPKSRPGFWQDGQLLMLDTPAMLRFAPGGIIDPNAIPRSPLYIGAVSGEQIATPSFLANRVQMIEPTTGATLDSADKFLRLLPPIGGALPIVRLRALRARVYSLEKKSTVDNAPVGKLVRYDFADGKKSSPFLLADDVQQVVLSRESITNKLIYFKIVRFRKEK